jgi:hypothetical protein
VTAETDVVNALLGEKLDAFKALHAGLPLSIGDELITTPNVDTTMSSRIITGPGKRTAIYPGGSVVTNLINIAAPITTVFSHWHGFLLDSVPSAASPPDPDKLLHGFDPLSISFQPFSPTIFSVAIRNDLNTITVSSLNLDSEQSIALAPANYRLRFTNITTNQTWFLSDWLLLHN